MRGMILVGLLALTPGCFGTSDPPNDAQAAPAPTQASPLATGTPENDAPPVTPPQTASTKLNCDNLEGKMLDDCQRLAAQNQAPVAPSSCNGLAGDPLVQCLKDRSAAENTPASDASAQVDGTPATVVTTLAQ